MYYPERGKEGGGGLRKYSTFLRENFLYSQLFFSDFFLLSVLKQFSLSFLCYYFFFVLLQIFVLRGRWFQAALRVLRDSTFSAPHPP